MNQGDNSSNYNEGFAKELLFHIDNLYHQRVNIFLVAEAIFFAAFASINEKRVKILVCLVGLIFSIALCYTLYRLHKGFNWVAEKYKELEKSNMYKDYRALGSPGVGSWCVFTIWLPGATIIAWVLMLIIIR